MRESKKARELRFFAGARARFGLEDGDTLELLKCSRQLRRWHERECGDGDAYASYAVEEDEETGAAWRVVYPHKGETHRFRIRNMAAGARRRIAAVMARYPGIVWRIQGDPRGPALVLYTPDENPESATGWGVDL